MLPHKFSFDAIGTKWEILTANELTANLKEVLLDRIESFDKTYSRFRDDSLVSKMKHQTGVFKFPKDDEKLIDFYIKLYELSAGKFTPLIGEALERAGYDADYSLVSQKQQDIPRLESVMDIKGTSITTAQTVTIDIGAAGKGYLVDILASILDEHKLKEYVIDASGDLIHKGPIETRVGLEDPRNPEKVIGIVSIQNKALCASATNRRAWGEGMHHIFDPLTKKPVSEIIATWVIADSTMVADGLATALFFMNPNVLAQEYRYQYVRMHSDGSLDYSHNFSGELF